MSMPISPPWLARRSSANAPGEGGQQVREQLSPLLVPGAIGRQLPSRDCAREWSAAEVAVCEGVTAMEFARRFSPRVR
jgi:hypothetical protein